MYLNKIIKLILMCLGMNMAYAGTPLWTFTPLTSTYVEINDLQTITVQYLVTNKSKKKHTLVMTPIRGVTQEISSDYCPAAFTLNYQQSCKLSLKITGRDVITNLIGGPELCQQGGQNLQCYQPNPEDVLTIIKDLNLKSTHLIASLNSLALKTNGNARTITIVNDDLRTVEDLFVNYPSWPDGTSATSTCTGSLAPGGSCTITVTPGAGATSDCNTGQGSEPVPGVITVGAANADLVSIGVVVLTYNCIHKKGYIFSIDDTTPTNISIAGTVASLSDNVSPISGAQWYNGSYVETGAQSLTDGVGNTVHIRLAQGVGSYAANICANYTIDASGNSPCSSGICYTDWYLPAICQMGNSAGGAGCSAGVANMEDNLSGLISDCSGSGCLLGTYWSSSEYITDPIFLAWVEAFSSSANIQNTEFKNANYGVRCVRDFE